MSDQEKDLEILILRQQLSILQRKQKHPNRLSRVEKLTLAVLTTKFKQTIRQTTNQLRGVIRIFQPEAVLRWQSFPRFSGDQYYSSPACFPQRHWDDVIEYFHYYNTARPHQGIDQQSPIPYSISSSGTIQCKNVLGGIIHDYYRAPTPLALPAT